MPFLVHEWTISADGAEAVGFQNRPVCLPEPVQFACIPVSRVSAQQQREMRSCQRLLKIRGASVHENLGIWKTVAGTRSAPLPGFSFDNTWTPAIVDAQLRHERERGLSDPARPEYVWDDVRYHDSSGPRGQRPPRHRTSERAEQPIGVPEQELADRPALGFVRIQQATVREASRNQAEFPSKVPRILNARVHALRADRAVDVRRVAGEEHVAAAIARRLAMVQVKAREPRRITKANGTGRWGVDERLQLRESEGADDLR
jgi:hypothetical protein